MVEFKGSYQTYRSGPYLGSTVWLCMLGLVQPMLSAAFSNIGFITQALHTSLDARECAGILDLLRLALGIESGLWDLAT